MTVSNVSSFLGFIIIILGFTASTVGLILLIISRGNHLGSVFLITGALAAIGSLVTMSLTGAALHFNKPETCVYCHEMRPEFDTWQTSKHKRVKCLACHMPVGGAGTFIGEELKALREVLAHFTGDYPKVINKDGKVAKKMKSDVCERCHDMSAPSSLGGSTGIKIDHQAHRRLNIKCQDCHNRVTHQGAGDYPYFDGMTMMDGCFRCHQPGRPKTIKNKRTPTDCVICHRQRDFAQKLFNKTKVGASDLDDCRACHRFMEPELVSEYDDGKMAREEVDCIDCHSGHAEDFIPKPAAIDCLECHEDAAAEVISGKMGFKRYKPPYKKEKEVRCDLCHLKHSFKAVRPASK